MENGDSEETKINGVATKEAKVRVVKRGSMKRDKLKCERCQLRGYSPDFCRWHKKKIAGIDVKKCYPQDFYKRVGKRVILGAGVGVVAATAGLAVAPAIGLKMAIGHALAAKITAGGCAAGAGINMTRGAWKGHPYAKLTRKREVLMPLYLKKGN